MYETKSQGHTECVQSHTRLCTETTLVYKRANQDVAVVTCTSILQARALLAPVAALQPKVADKVRELLDKARALQLRVLKQFSEKW